MIIISKRKLWGYLHHSHSVSMDAIVNHCLLGVFIVYRKDCWNVLLRFELKIGKSAIIKYMLRHIRLVTRKGIMIIVVLSFRPASCFIQSAFSMVCCQKLGE